MAGVTGSNKTQLVPLFCYAGVTVGRRTYTVICIGDSDVNEHLVVAVSAFSLHVSHFCIAGHYNVINRIEMSKKAGNSTS